MHVPGEYGGSVVGAEPAMGYKLYDYEFIWNGVVLQQTRVRRGADVSELLVAQWGEFPGVNGT